MTDHLTEDEIDQLDIEQCNLKIELSTFRVELVAGFTDPARKARCGVICRRLNQIDRLLDEDEE